MDDEGPPSEVKMSVKRDVSKSVGNSKAPYPVSILMALLILSSSLSFIIIQSARAPPAAWVPELVDGNTTVGEYNSLAFDSAGIPHIAYKRSNPLPNGILHAYKIGGVWYNETVFQGAGNVGRFVSLIIDSQNILHISFFANMMLYYSTNASGTWITTEVDEDPMAIVGWYTSIAVDSSNNPRIAYYDKSNGRLKYAYRDVSSWSIEVVDSSGVDAGKYCSLALGPDDTPRISYFYENDSNVWMLKQAWKTGSIWNAEIITDLGSPGQYTSIAVDATGGIHISHYRLNGRDLMYSYNDGTGWTTQAVETVGDVGFYTSIALDTAGEPHIAHYDKTNEEIKRTWWEAGTWHTETIVSPGTLKDPGGSISIFMPPDNQPGISYYDANNQDQMYAQGYIEFVDLAVVEVWLVPSGPFDEGTNVEVCANITNQGNQDSGAFIVRFYDGDPDSGGTQVGTDQSIAFLPPTGYSILNVTWTATPIGVHQIYAEVNPDNAVFDPFQGNDKDYVIAEVVGPDLEIAPGNVTVAPAPPLAEGSNVTVTALVANIGLSNVTDIVVRFFNGDPEAGGTPIGEDQIIASLNVSESTAVSVSWTAGPLGTQVLFAVVDPDNLIEEVMETNNQANVTVLVSAPDLSVQSSGIILDPLSPVTVGTNVSVNAIVRNIGLTEAGNFSVAFYDGDPSGGGQMFGEDFPLNLPPSGQTLVVMIYFTNSNGLHDICVLVDRLDAVRESDEGNNLACVPLEVTSIPSPPSDLNAFLSGSDFENITLSWSLSPDDGAGKNNVVRYDIYRGSTYDLSGLSYLFHAPVPAGTPSYMDAQVGEGDPSKYFYRICAVSDLNFSGCSPTQAGKFTLSLAEGPQLISIPLIQSNESVEIVLQTISYDKAWSYDASSQEWKWYMSFKTYRRDLWSVNHTAGLWINVTEESNLTVAGVVPVTTNIHLSAGWNLVGFPSLNSSFTVSQLNVAIGAERVEGIDAFGSPFYLRVLQDWEVLHTGFGYWIRVASENTWIVEFS